MRMVVYSVFFLLIGLATGGCVLAPVISAVSDLGATEGDRQRLLNKDLKTLNDALASGRYAEALRFVAEDKRQEFKKDFRRNEEDEKIVDTKIYGIDFIEDSYKADVEIGVKYYKVPYFVVNERKELQTWQFSMSGGWQMISRELV